MGLFCKRAPNASSPKTQAKSNLSTSWWENSQKSICSELTLHKEWISKTSIQSELTLEFSLIMHNNFDYIYIKSARYRFTMHNAKTEVSFAKEPYKRNYIHYAQYKDSRVDS